VKLCGSCGACFDDGYDLCGFDGGKLSAVFAGSRVVGGRYLLEQRVASGAMGVVVRATHLQVGSTVAVKLMRPEERAFPASGVHVALARFQREAQILGQIKHPNAVLVMDFGIERRGDESVPYLVMEYLRGESLAAVLEKKTRLSLEELDRLLGPLCEAVEEAHAVGVIHRDLKPSNVVLEKLRDGSEIVKVLDFGIAKLISRGPAPSASPVGHASAPASAPAPVDLPASTVDPDLTFDELDELADLLASDDDEFIDEVAATKDPTQPPTVTDRQSARSGVAEKGVDKHASTEAGFMIGTVPYMAPEQMTGERVSRRTDVHALAVLAFQCLAGRLPYDGDDEDIIAAKLSDDRPSLREMGVDVPPALDELLQRAFAVNPNERPATVRELADAVRAALHATRGDRADANDGDPVVAVTVHLDVAARSLAAAAAAVKAWVDSDASIGAEEHYARARDVLLAVDAPLRRARTSLEQTQAPLPSEARDALLASKESLAARASDVRRGLARVELGSAGGRELGDYLTALWLRLDVITQEIVDALVLLTEDETTGNSAAPLFATELFAASQEPRTVSLGDLADRLIARDPLDGVDALEELLTGSLDQVVRALGSAGREDALAARLARGLWRHADSILLYELTPSRRAFRLLPFLAGLRDLPGAEPFSLLARVLGNAALDDDGARVALAALERPDDRAVVARCLLVHPSHAARAVAVAQLELSALWSVIAHPSAPIAVLRFLFEHVRSSAPNEYLKIFFFCVRETLRAAASPNDVVEALRLLQVFFQTSSFHEDIVFEPLLDVERTVRQRAASVASVQSAKEHQLYADALASFTAGGVRETKPLEQMRDVPLPIQRKLAREGHFLTYFVSHSNDRVARETLPHLFRLDDVTPFLRIATIHRIVLTELAKRKRFFRKDQPKIALLQNPKTPAIIARVFLPLVSSDQLRLLSTNKHINPDVRRLITTALAKAPS
jgi:serine/threonine protein kinase